MNYKQCEDFLELHRHKEAMGDEQLENLRQSLHERLGVSERTQEEQKICRTMLCLDSRVFSVATVVYLERALKLAGYKVMTYCKDALGDYRNRWRISGRPISQKSLCEIVKMVQEASEQVPSRNQLEQLVADMAFLQGDAKVLLWYGNYQGAKEEGIAKYDVPMIDLRPYKVTKKSSKKQVFRYELSNHPDRSVDNVVLTALGKEALEGACETLELLDFLNEKGLKVEEKHVRLAFEEVSAKNTFGVIKDKPLFVLDSAQSIQAAQRLKEDIEAYLPKKQIALLLGATKKTEMEGLLENLCGKVSFVLAVAPPRIDRIPSYELAKEVLKYHQGVSAVDSMEEAIEIVNMMLDKDGAVLAVGCEEMLSQVIAIVNKDIF